MDRLTHQEKILHAAEMIREAQEELQEILPASGEELLWIAENLEAEAESGAGDDFS